MKKTSKCLGIISIAMAILFTFAACGGVDDDSPYEPAVYIAGFYFEKVSDDPSVSIRKACYWKNEQRVDLHSTTDPGSEAYSIAVADGHVYVAGVLTTGDIDTRACYWKDGQLIDLAGGVDSYATAIAVENVGGSHMVYIAGYYDDGVDMRGCYWRGGAAGAREDLSDESSVISGAFAIAVKGGEVYTAGVYDDGGGVENACYWYDMERKDLHPTGADLSIASSIAIDTSGASPKIYTAGLYVEGSSGKACYWINDDKEPIPLLDLGASSASAIALAGGKPYIAGAFHEGTIDKACYWHNDGVTKLAVPEGAGNSDALAITVHNGLVLTAGEYYDSGTDKACYWKGSKRTDLKVPATATGSHATGIFVR